LQGLQYDNHPMKTVDQIAAELQGYDPNALPADKVNAFLAELVTPVTQTERVNLFAALGRVLAQDVVSPISVPPHDNSAMDGFALRGAQLNASGASRFKVVGTALAGKAWKGAVGAGECVKIMTGAIMPAGLDTVVPQEQCKLLDDVIEIQAGVLQTGDNRRFKGEDLMQGAPALSKGELLKPAALGLLASLNISQVNVLRKLRVAYFSTGDEVLSLGDAPREGAIYDSNRYTVYGMLTRLGVDMIDMGVVRDDPALLEAAFQSAATQADAIITSGGVSVGEADYTKAMMHKLGGNAKEGGGVAFWKIAMRPGRPMAVGRIARPAALRPQNIAPEPILQGKSASSPIEYCTGSSEINSAVLFGLPGNPVAVMVTMLAFVRPALLRMMGADPAKYCSAPLYLQAHSTEPLRKKPGRTEYQRGTVTRAPDGKLQVKTTGNQGSGVLSSMVQANGLIVLHHGQGNVAVGDVVDVLMFDGAM
jgi:molybdopterin molybdotransferase